MAARLADDSDGFWVDTSTPHAARVDDYLLGGGLNWQSDRELAREVVRRFPGAAAAAWSNRAFARRVVRYVLDRGVTQFLDLGCGLPAVGGLHEIAQRIESNVRVLYVDSDPVVVEYCRHILRDRGIDGVQVYGADLLNADAVLEVAGRWGLPRVWLTSDL